MSTWLEDYLAALEIRDTREKADAETVSLYTQLANRYAELQKQSRNAEPAAEPQASSSPPPTQQTRIPTPLLGGRRASSPKTPVSPALSNDAVRLRADLAAANRTSHDLTAQVQTLTSRVESLSQRASTQDDESERLRATIARLEGEKVVLTRRVKDRESELTEKARLVESVQDEMVSLEMQANVADEKAQRLERENKELVERWMKRVGEEAEDMNKGSGWK